MLKSIGKNIIINSAKNSEYEKNGIIIKNTSISNLIGNVVSVGSEVAEIVVGDKVVYNESNSKKLLFENNEYFVVNEKEVLAII